MYHYQLIHHLHSIDKESFTSDSNNEHINYQSRSLHDINDKFISPKVIYNFLKHYHSISNHQNKRIWFDKLKNLTMKYQNQLIQLNMNFNVSQCKSEIFWYEPIKQQLMINFFLTLGFWKQEQIQQKQLNEDLNENDLNSK